MCAPTPVQPPDPSTVAQAQGTENRSTAVANANLNRIDQYTPFGSSTYDQSGTNQDGTPHYSQTVSLSPQEQTLFDIGTSNQAQLAKSAQGMLGQVQGSYANPIDTSGAPGIASHVQQDGATTREAIQNAQDAAYRSQTQYLDPQFQQGQAALDTKLANQGVAHGSQAEKDAQSNYGLQKQQAYQSARDSATSSGQAEQARLYGQALSSADLQNQGQAQFLQQLFSLRNQPLNEYNALTTGSQVQSPTFNSVPTTQQANTNVAGIYQDNFNNQLANAQRKDAFTNNLFQLGGNLGAAAILA